MKNKKILGDVKLIRELKKLIGRIRLKRGREMGRGLRLGMGKFGRRISLL